MGYIYWGREGEREDVGRLREKVMYINQRLGGESLMHWVFGRGGDFCRTSALR